MMELQRYRNIPLYPMNARLALHCQTLFRRKSFSREKVGEDHNRLERCYEDGAAVQEVVSINPLSISEAKPDLLSLPLIILLLHRQARRKDGHPVERIGQHVLPDGADITLAGVFLVDNSIAVRTRLALAELEPAAHLSAVDDFVVDDAAAGVFGCVEGAHLESSRCCCFVGYRVLSVGEVGGSVRLAKS